MAIEESFDRGLGLTRGDAFPWRRRVTGLRGLTITKARMTVKAAPATDADPGLLQKSITSSNSADGLIEDTGSVTGIAVLRFDMTSANTLAAVAGTKYTFDLQATLSDGQILTLIKGPFVAGEQVTVSNP